MSTFRSLRNVIRYIQSGDSLYVKGAEAGIDLAFTSHVPDGASLMEALSRLTAVIEDKYPRRHKNYTPRRSGRIHTDPLGCVWVQVADGGWSLLSQPYGPPPAPVKRGTRPKRTTKQLKQPAPTPPPADRFNFGPSKRGFTDWLNDITLVELSRCEDCSGYIFSDDCCYIDRGGYSVCQRCYDRYYRECDDCGYSYHRDNGFRAYGDRSICESCGDDYNSCDNCGISVHSDDSYSVHGSTYCPSCYEEEEDSDDAGGDLQNVYEHSRCVIRHYAHPKFLQLPHEITDHKGNGKAKQPTLWMGFELEVMYRDTNQRTIARAELAKAIEGRCILKSDSSLHGPGFEVVSLPATLAFHQAHWGGMLEVLQKYMRGWDEKSCGFHVHMNREALTPAQIGKMLVFMNGDGKTINNRTFIEHIAGRSSGEYTKFFSKKLTFGLPSQYSYRERTGGLASLLNRDVYGHLGTSERGSGESRYQAINLQPANTIEVRIFQSNIAKLGFVKNIEFCDALARFCADASMQQMHKANFISWVDERRGIYPALTAWMVRAGMMRQKHKLDPKAEPVRYMA